MEPQSRQTVSNKILGYAAALSLLMSGAALADEAVRLPTVVEPPGIAAPQPTTDPLPCSLLLAEESRNKTSCGASGGVGVMAFDDSRGGRRQCSFVFVNDGRPLLEKAQYPSVLTAAHCLRHGIDPRTVQLRFAPSEGGTSVIWANGQWGHEGGSDLVMRDSGSDIALLRTRNWNGETFCLNPLGPIPSEGDRVHGYGVPSNETEAFEGDLAYAGRFSFAGGGLPAFDGYRVDLTNGEIVNGMSGGGLFDRRNRLIGMVAASAESDCAIAYFGRLGAFRGLGHLDDPDSNRSDPTRVIERSRMPSVTRLRIVAGEPSNEHAEFDQRASHYINPFGSGANYHRIDVTGRVGLHAVLDSCSIASMGHRRGIRCAPEQHDEYRNMSLELRGEDDEILTASRYGRDGKLYLAEFLRAGTYYVRVGLRRERYGGYGLLANLGGAHRTGSIPFFLSPEDSRMGFLRVTNNDDKIAFAKLTRLNDESDAITVLLKPKEARHFNALDLQDGNPDKDVGTNDAWRALPSSGPWSLESESAWDVEVLPYSRTADGLVASTAAAVPFVKDGENDVREVFFFNPASNYRQRSLLRITNLIHPANVTVQIEGTDDSGNVSNVEVSLYDNDWSTVTLTAADLEEGTGPGVSGALGDGVGKWRLKIISDPEATGFVKERPATSVLNLLESPTGHLINLSDRPSLPSAAEAGKVVKDVPLFLALSEGRMGFLRVANGADEEAKVKLTAIREDGSEAGSLWVPLAPNEARHFNARDLQDGNPGKGIAEGEGFGDLEDGENWRLRLESESDFEAQAYSRTEDGLVTDTTQIVARRSDGDQDIHRIAFFNPGSNYRQRSLLRVTNLIHPDAVTLHVEGMDDAGRVSSVEIRLEERETITLSAADLEEGVGLGVTGALHDGQGKWRLKLTADPESASSQQRSENPVVRVMNLLESPTGHLINLSEG